MLKPGLLLYVPTHFQGLSLTCVSLHLDRQSMMLSQPVFCVISGVPSFNRRTKWLNDHNRFRENVQTKLVLLNPLLHSAKESGIHGALAIPAYDRQEFVLLYYQPVTISD